MKPLLIIGGATGSGKSDVAVACAKLLGGEVISCDSMQIYRGLDVGTAKIRPEETAGIPHHMIDIVDPKDSFTAAEYKAQAAKLIESITSKGKVAILCGGTGLYVNAVLYDLSFSGDFDPELRASLQQEARENGKEYMHAKLMSLDPEAAARLHVNDEKRVIRAIEKALTGGSKENDFVKAKYPYRIFVTDLPREELYKRIDRRVDKMMQEGLKNEVERLLAEGVGFDKQCMQAIAYKEWAEEIAGRMTEQEVVELIKKNTRNYAKRQITWFKQYKDAYRINVWERTSEDVAKEICDKYNEEV